MVSAEAVFPLASRRSLFEFLPEACDGLANGLRVLDHEAGTNMSDRTCRRVGSRGFVVLGTHSGREEVEEDVALSSILQLRTAILRPWRSGLPANAGQYRISVLASRCVTSNIII